MARRTQEHQHAAEQLTQEKALPADLQAERAVLGSILLNDQEHWDKAAAVLTQESWSTEAHRRIWARMCDLAARSERVNRLTLASELQKHGQLESIGGLTALVDLDANLPDLPDISSVLRLVLEKAKLRQVIFLAQRAMDAAYQGTDSQEIAAHVSERLAPIQVGADPPSQFQRPSDVVSNFPGGLNAFLDPTHRVRGINTGFSRFDDMTSGLHAGELIILAARPSMGKTALALNIAQYVATHPKSRKPVAFFSLEMSSSSLLTRMVCSAARVDAHKFRCGYLNADERRKLQVHLSDISDAPLFLDDTPGINIHEIHAKLRRLKEKEGLELAVIDYVGLMGSKGKGENRNQEVSVISRGLKLMAKELGVPLLVLSQLNRAVETRTGQHKPQLSDLRESGSLEQDADLVAFIWREEIYKPDREDVKGLADLIIAKQRNGPIGTVNLRFLGQYTRFESRVDDLPEDPGEQFEPAPPASFYEKDDESSW